MAATDTLLRPETCAMLLVDFQAGLGFGVESASRQVLLNNAVALARTAAAFSVPVVVSTSASRVYSGPLLPALQDALPAVRAIERKPMNVWEDETVRNAIVATGRKRLILAGFLTEACVSFSALSALDDGFDVFVVADPAGSGARRAGRYRIAPGEEGVQLRDDGGPLSDRRPYALHRTAPHVAYCKDSLDAGFERQRRSCP